MLFFNSLIYAGISLMVYYALVDAPIALVKGVRQLQVFFVLLMGYLFLKDKISWSTLLGSIIMILGVLMIKFS